MGLGDGRPLSARYQSEVIELPEELRDRDAGAFESVNNMPSSGPGPGGGPATNGLPAGGTDGQVLTKVGSADYASTWTTPPPPVTPEEPLPAGGNKGDELVKVDSAAGNATWRKRNVVNVRDHGATGNGVDPDDAAIAAAIAALQDNDCLYFPHGTYPTYGFSLDGKINILVLGEGAQIKQLGAGDETTMFVSINCAFIRITGLWFMGSATGRHNGIHLRMNGQYSSIDHCRFERATGFGVFIGSGDVAAGLDKTVRGSRFTNNLVIDCMGDGVHLSWVDGFIVTDNIIWMCGDDAIAPLAAGQQTVKNGVVANNYIKGRSTALGTGVSNGYRGIAIMGGFNIRVANNVMDGLRGPGIYVGDEVTGSVIYNEHIDVIENTMLNCQKITGPPAAIILAFCKRVRVAGNRMQNVTYNYGLAFGDIHDAVIEDNWLESDSTNAFRPILAIGDTTFDNRVFALTWTNIYIRRNHCKSVPMAAGGEGLYLAAHPTVKFDNLVIDGNEADTAAAPSLVISKVDNLAVINNRFTTTAATPMSLGTIAGRALRVINNYSGGVTPLSFSIASNAATSSITAPNY